MKKSDRSPGRPKGTPGTKKAESIEIRVTTGEKEAFREAASMAGIGLSTWIRERLRLTAIRELEAAGRRVRFVTPLPLGGTDA